ncbi:MAG TPA: hypothetical protein VHB45_14320 [Alloacidobacterium sp.]|nr:hypothetical protein [Alloacidobacterium sp.]
MQRNGDINVAPSNGGVPGVGSSGSGSTGAMTVSTGQQFSSQAAAAAVVGNSLANIPTRKMPSSLQIGSYLVIIPASGYAQFPPVSVPVGATVKIRAHNGQAAGNAAPVQIVGSREQAIAATRNGYVLDADDDTEFPADNLSQIWVCGTPGDGAIANVAAAK